MNRASQIRSELNRLRRRFRQESKQIDENGCVVFVTDPETDDDLFSRCTVSAALFAWEFDGKVMGYDPKNNPQAMLRTWGTGHDFALIDDRWLVDFWAWNTFQYRDLYDLQSPGARADVNGLYGDPATWDELGKRYLKFWVGVVKRIGYEVRKFR